MRKLLLFLIILLITTISISAQISWDVRGGVNFSSLRGSRYSIKPEFHLGTSLDIPFANPKFAVQVGAYLMGKGTREEYTHTEGDIVHYAVVMDIPYHMKREVRAYYIEVPILALYRLQLPKDWEVHMGVGPYIALGVFGKTDVKINYKENFYPDFSKQENTFDNLMPNFDAGMSFNFTAVYKKYSVKIGYDWGLTNAKEGSRFLSTRVTKYQTSSVFISVGYKII